VPEGDEARKNFISDYLIGRNAAVADEYRDLLIQRYGQEQGSQIRYAEAFELCQYGAQPSAAELNELFPM
ncbi:MAG TPA: PIG-L family deacetylase, partial [Blastocatellia bacterium]